MLTLYDFLDSGNGYKCRLLLSQLGLPFRLLLKDILKGETRSEEFLQLNPNGRIPLLLLEDGRTLAESGAILHYLAEGTAFLPDDRYGRAETLQWMFFEQYSHEPNIAVARFWRHFVWAEKAGDPYWERALEERMARGYQALEVMERHMAERPYFAAGRYGIADIALYAYTHVAHEGGFELARYPAVRAWLDRVADRPGHVLITQADFA
jgi:glutathione S-transferase